jgi:hypothetical protein
LRGFILTKSRLQAEFVKKLASNPENIVIGLVRNVADTEARMAEWKTPNIHILQADMTNWESLKVLIPNVQGTSTGNAFTRKPQKPLPPSHLAASTISSPTPPLCQTGLFSIR